MCSVIVIDYGWKYYECMKLLFDEMVQVDGELMSSMVEIFGFVRIVVLFIFGWLYVLLFVFQLLVFYFKLKLDFVLVDGVQDLLVEGVDFVIWISFVYSFDVVVKWVVSSLLVCVGLWCYFEQYGMLEMFEDLVWYNCIIFNGIDSWVFDGLCGKFNVWVSGNLLFNMVEMILLVVWVGVGIGMFYCVLLVGELCEVDVVIVFDEFIIEIWDVSFIWLNCRFILVWVWQVIEFFVLVLVECV